MLPRTACRAFGCLLLALLTPAPGVSAQRAPADSEQPAPGGRRLSTSNTGDDARSLRCWWKPDRTSVRAGERFHLTLTCQILETAAERAAPDERLLDPAAISLAPYEVVEGIRYPDVRQGPWRFIQYQYTLRLIGEDVFGTDVAIPALALKYRAERTTGAGEQIGGQDRTYTLPAYPIRIASLVPKNAADIADGSDEVFGDMRVRRFRADAAFVLAAVLFVLPTAVAFSLLMRTTGRGREKTRRDRKVETAWLLRNLETELAQVKTSREMSGWNEGLIGRALTALRITGSLALDQPVTEHALATGATALVGRLALRKRPFRSGRVAITSTLTPERLARQLAEATGPRPGHAARREFLTNGFDQAFAAFNEARYAAATEQDDTTLDEALTKASDGLRALRREHTWAGRTARAFPRAWRHPWTRS